MTDKSEFDKGGERIAKAIARAGLASRREAEEWIAAGRVAVNGEVIRSPALNVTGNDRISVDGEPLPARERTRLFLYHKPRGLITTHADPRGRPTIFQRLPNNLPRLISVGRLDFNTEGLLLLTNDGALARVLELPATGWLRRYRVRAHGAVTQQQLDELRDGVTVEGIRYGPIEAGLDRVQGSNLWLTFAMREGKKREVRNVLGHLGLVVTRLIRVSFGPFQLGDLATGAIEEVRTRVLREQLREQLIALAGSNFSAPVIERAVGKDGDPTMQAKRTAKDERRERPGRRSSRRGAPRRAAQGGGKDEAKSRRNDQSRPALPIHSWRAREDEHPQKKLRRRFRGSRRDDGTPREPSTGELRAGLLTDRKGRRVPVERFVQAPMPKTPERRPRHPPHPRSTPRPSRPRGR